MSRRTDKWNLLYLFDPLFYFLLSLTHDVFRPSILKLQIPQNQPKMRRLHCPLNKIYYRVPWRSEMAWVIDKNLLNLYQDEWVTDEAVVTVTFKLTQIGSSFSQEKHQNCNEIRSRSQ